MSSLIEVESESLLLYPKENSMRDSEGQGKREKPKRITKPGYPFTPKEASLLAEGHGLAKAYGITFNQLLTFLLENAIQEWCVPFMTQRSKPGEGSTDRGNEEVFPEK